MLSLYGGKEPYCTRSLLLRRNNQYAGLRVPARGVQVLERLGPESAENLYSHAPSGPCRGLQNLCCRCMAGRNPTVHVRYFLGETISTRACRCRPGDAGEYRFWNAWGLKVPKTCTPPRPPGNEGDYRTCAVFVWREGTLHVRYFLGETISTRTCGCRPGDAGEYRFWNAWGLKVPKTCTPPRPPGNAGDYRTCAVFVWREGTLHVRYFLGEAIKKRACGCRPGDDGGVQVLERLGLESAENLYFPAPPGPCRGLQNLCCRCMAGRNPTVHVRYFLGETISTRACGCRPGTRGSTGFGTLGA